MAWRRTPWLCCRALGANSCARGARSFPGRLDPPPHAARTTGASAGASRRARRSHLVAVGGALRRESARAHFALRRESARARAPRLGFRRGAGPTFAPHHTLARHAPHTQTPRNEFRTVRPVSYRPSWPTDGTKLVGKECELENVLCSVVAELQQATLAKWRQCPASWFLSNLRALLRTGPTLVALWDADTRAFQYKYRIRLNLNKIGRPASRRAVAVRVMAVGSPRRRCGGAGVLPPAHARVEAVPR